MEAPRPGSPRNIFEWADVAGLVSIAWSVCSTSWLVDPLGRLLDPTDRTSQLTRVVSIGLVSSTVHGVAKAAGIATILLSALIALLVVGSPGAGRPYPRATFGAALAALASAVAFMWTFQADAPEVAVPVPFVPGRAALPFVAGVLLVLLGTGLRAARRAQEEARATA
jgi:hypothetical protein